MAVSTYALTSLTDAKLSMGVSASTDDTLIENLIDSASAAIEKYCDRLFVTRGLTREWHGHGGGKSLQVRNYPVTSLYKTASGCDNAISVTSETSTDLQAVVSVLPTAVELRRVDSVGAATVTTLAFASYLSTSLMATAIDGTSGWSASVIANVPIYDLHPIAGQSAKDRTAYLTYASDIDFEVRLDAERGVLDMVRSGSALWGDGNGGEWAAGHQHILVEYAAGYANTAAVPDDLQQICRDIVQMMYRTVGTDERLVSETIGSYSYSRSTSEATQAILSTPSLTARLAVWRRWR